MSTHVVSMWNNGFPTIIETQRRGEEGSKGGVCITNCRLIACFNLNYSAVVVLNFGVPKRTPHLIDIAQSLRAPVV